MGRLVAIAVLGVIMLIATVAMAVGVSSTGDEHDPLIHSILFVGLWLYWGLGALIVGRADGHVVGWLFAVGAAMMASVFASFPIASVLGSSQPPNPIGAWFFLVGTLLFPAGFVLILPAVALTFPTGALPGPRWRWPVRVIAAMVGALMVATVIRPGPMGESGQDNPLTPWLQAVSPNLLESAATLEAIGSMSLLLVTGLGVAAIVIRFRRSHGDERQQLKGFVAAMALAAVAIPLTANGDLSSSRLLIAVGVATLSIVPLSVAIAILRYRLYDIDRVISRTISYGLVTALLVAVFLLVNLGLQWLLSSVTSGNSLAVAGSTLLAAALFTPVRKRIQSIVDRRFDRARYDGERTAGAFSDRMRDATDLPTLVDDLDRTVRQAMAPSRVGLWLR